MASKTKSSFTPVSDTEKAELLREKPKGVIPQITLTPPPEAETPGENDQPAAVESTATVTPPKTTTPPAGAGTEHVEHKPELQDEVREVRTRLRPEIGPDGKSLPSADALEEAITKGQEKERENREADEKAAAEKARAGAKSKDKAETPAATDTEVKPAVAEAGQEDLPTDEEMIQFLKPRSQHRFLSMLAETKELKAKLEAAETEKKALAEKALAPEGDPKAKEELESLRTEVARFRRHYELENDPEVKTKFDEPAQAAEAAIVDLLKNYQVGEPTLKAIEAAGGFAEFSRSDTKFPVVIDGENIEMTAAELARNWMASMRVGDVALLNTKLSEQITAKSGKKAFVETEKKRAREYFTKRDTDARAAQETAVASAKKIESDYSAWTDELLKTTPWLQLEVVPDNATEEEKHAIADRNEYTKQMRELPKAVKNIKTVKDFQEIIMGNLQFHHVRRDMLAKDREIAALKEENETLKAGASTTGRSGSIRTGSRPPKEEKPKKFDPRTVNSADALEAAIEAGESKRESEE